MAPPPLLFLLFSLIPLLLCYLHSIESTTESYHPVNEKPRVILGVLIFSLCLLPPLSHFYLFSLISLKSTLASGSLVTSFPTKAVGLGVFCLFNKCLLSPSCVPGTNIISFSLEPLESALGYFLRSHADLQPRPYQLLTLNILSASLCLQCGTSTPWMDPLGLDHLALICLFSILPYPLGPLVLFSSHSSQLIDPKHTLLW